MSKLKTLRSNLIVFSAIQKPDQLIALRGKLYAKASLSGRFVSWICSFLLKQDNVEEVLKSSKDQFSSMIDRLDQLQKDYFSNESSRLRGLPFQKGMIAQAEKEILYSCLLFRPLFKAFSKVRPCFFADQMKEHHKEWGRVCRQLRFIDKKRTYEALARQPLPLELLVKSAFEKPLKVREEKELKRWVSRIVEREKGQLKGFRGKYSHGMVTGKKLHRFFYDVYHRLVKPEKAAVLGGNPSLGALEERLESLGLKMANEKDAVHQEWVQTLASGQTIHLQGKALVLGAEVTTEYEKEQERRSFAIEDHDDVVFYKNEAGPYLTEFQAHKEHYGIPLVSIISRKEKGKIAIREKITDTLDQIIWTSKSELTKEDSVKATPILELIALFSQLPYTPYPLDVNAFGYNEKGEMRALRPMKQSAFFFEALEQFVYRIAQGNSIVFRHLMRQSSMEGSEAAKEYREFVAKTLEAVAFNKEVVFPEKHPEILKRYHLLAQGLSECYQREMQKEGQSMSRSDLAIALYRKYKTEGYCSFLPPNFAL